MILSFNARDTHPRDKKVISWYKGLYKSERSRKIIEVLYAHIEGGQHSISHEIGISPSAIKEEISISMMDITGGEELDLDSKLDMLGGNL